MRILVTGGSGFIGTNFVHSALASGHEIKDLSLHAPLNSEYQHLWDGCDIMDSEAVRSHMQHFRPDAVLHLAARAECDETTTVQSGYRMNTDGTANVLSAVGATPSVRRLIITSSQYVCSPGRLPTSDDDYFPVTVYGESKVITEQLTRSARLDCAWTIIRPTNVWGPWHMRYAREFWKIAQRGLYVHPGGAPVVRSYAYVGNVVEQILGIFSAPIEQVAGKTLYTTDAPDDIYKWADAFCRHLSGRPARRVPRMMLRTAGLVGDMISHVRKKPFYITQSRYRSMITNYPTPYRETFDLLGDSVFSLEDGVQNTVNWLRSEVDGF